MMMMQQWQRQRQCQYQYQYQQYQYQPSQLLTVFGVRCWWKRMVAIQHQNIVTILFLLILTTKLMHIILGRQCQATHYLSPVHDCLDLNWEIVWSTGYLVSTGTDGDGRSQTSCRGEIQTLSRASAPSVTIAQASHSMHTHYTLHITHYTSHITHHTLHITQYIVVPGAGGYRTIITSWNTNPIICWCCPCQAPRARAEVVKKQYKWITGVKPLNHSEASNSIMVWFNIGIHVPGKSWHFGRMIEFQVRHIDKLPEGPTVCFMYWIPRWKVFWQAGPARPSRQISIFEYYCMRSYVEKVLICILSRGGMNSITHSRRLVCMENQSEAFTN